MQVLEPESKEDLMVVDGEEEEEEEEEEEGEGEEGVTVVSPVQNTVSATYVLLMMFVFHLTVK